MGLGLKCVKESQQEIVTTPPYSSSWLRKVWRGENVLLKWGLLFGMKGRISWLGDIVKAKMSYWEKLWNVLQSFLKTEDSLIRLGWQTQHLLWVSSLHPPNGSPLLSHLTTDKCVPYKNSYLLCSSIPSWSPRCPLLRISSAASGPIWVLFSLLGPPYLELPVFLSSCCHTGTYCHNSWSIL